MISTPVDVVVAAYEQFDYWPLLCRGFAKNQQHINSVILSLDQKITADQTVFLTEEYRKHNLSAPLIITTHEHKGFGLCKTANQGIALARTEYVLLVEGDEILGDDLSDDFTLAAPKTLACCRKKCIDPTKGIDPPYIIANDHRQEAFKDGLLDLRSWFFCSGGHLLIHKEIHDKIGGFDEKFTYGYHDFDYAIRWVEAGGKVVYGGGHVWHLGSGAGRAAHSDALSKFLPTLARHYDNRYYIGCGRIRLPDYINVDAWTGSAADIIQNCRDLDWIPPNTAKVIFSEHFIEHLTAQDAIAFVESCYRALMPGGQLILAYPDVFKCAGALLLEPTAQIHALQGIFGDATDLDVNPLQTHRWGWSAQSMKTLLEDIGFEVSYAGDDYCANHYKWRDSRVEAYKVEKNG